MSSLFEAQAPRPLADRLRPRRLDEVVGHTASVIEGIATTRSILALAERADIEMPISQGVGQVIFEGRTPRQVMGELMTRQPKPEQDSP